MERETRKRRLLTTADLVQRYDREMQSSEAEFYYGQSDFYNFGYWDSATANQRQASENLVTQLVALLPAPKGRILDVACGMGATTRSLGRWFPAGEITAVNLSLVQLQNACRNAPHSHFAAMDAALLAIRDETFENLICVEAAFHFHSRDRFLAEAWRVLKPGGCLVLSDILYTPARSNRYEAYLPQVNFIPDPLAYRDRLHQLGFESCRVIEATEACWHGFRRNLLAAPGAGWRSGRLDLLGYLRQILITRLRVVSMGFRLRHYLLAAACKPAVV